jgi:hypothetical protein
MEALDLAYDVGIEDDEEKNTFGQVAGNLELSGLLERARKAQRRTSGVTSADLQVAIRDLEDAVQRGGPEAVEERAERLLDLLYELEDDE